MSSEEARGVASGVPAVDAANFLSLEQLESSKDLLTDWEINFYTDILKRRDAAQQSADGQDFDFPLSEKQLKYKSAIEGKIAAKQPLLQQVKAARESSRVTEWEVNFVKENICREQLSEKQQAIWQKIMMKVSGSDQILDPAAPRNADGSPKKKARTDLSANFGCTRAQLEAAASSGKINEYEAGFAEDNFFRVGLSEKQQAMVNKIKEKIHENATNLDSISDSWGFSKREVEAVFGAGKITQWERNFVENNWSRSSFSEKQQPIVDQIREKISAWKSRAEPSEGRSS